MLRFTTRAALAGVAAAALYAGPASAQSSDLNYFWEYSESGGVVTNQLYFISTAPSFTAQLFAETIGANPFQNATGDLMQGGGANASYFHGGPQDPILVGNVDGTGSARIDSVVDATWISDWPNNVFPVGGIANPISAGQFSVGDSVDGQYTIRINNNAGPEVEINGSISDGRFSQVLMADANLDGSVNGADANIWRANFGTGTLWVEADWNGDDLVNGADANLWRANFGSTTNSSNTRVGGDGFADFTYDPVTGELSVSADGESVWSINIATSQDVISENVPAQWAFTAQADSVEWTDQSIGFFPLAANETFVLGTLATGLSASDFGDVTYFTTANTATNIGAVEVIPEPGSLALLGLGGLALIRRRR